MQRFTVDVAAVAEPVGDVTAVLGEGPYWVPEDDCLLWVDIQGGLLHRTYFPSGETVTDLPGPVSAVFPAAAAASSPRAAPAHPALPGRAGRPVGRQDIAEVPARDGIRFNDAGVDPTGRVGSGSMHTSESEPLGELYRLDAGGVLTGWSRARRCPTGSAGRRTGRGCTTRTPAAPGRRVRLRPGDR